MVETEHKQNDVRLKPSPINKYIKYKKDKTMQLEGRDCQVE